MEEGTGLRTEATEEEHDGSGHGLAIASEIAEAHETELEIDSTVGAGTRVCFRLPRASNGEKGQSAK